MKWLDEIQWNEKGLVPVITQEHESGDVLMFAWMNRAALMQTIVSGQAVYYSRSREGLWLKGETSGHTQSVREIRLDCDHDVLLMQVSVNSKGPSIACHTGRHRCFFQRFVPGVSDPLEGGWEVTDAVLEKP